MKRILSLMLTAMVGITAMTGCGTGEAQNTGGPQDGAAAGNAPITVVSREDGSGTRGAFIELFGVEVKGDDGSKKDMTTVEAVIANKTDVMLTNIASDPNAIGYVSLGSLNDGVKALTVDGVTASAENVKDGSYAVARPFMIATKGEATGLAKDFIDFILSREGQAVVNGSYIAIEDDATPFAGSKAEGRIAVAGSSSVTPVMEKLKEAYVALNPNAIIEIQMSDSTAGMTAAIEGTADIGMASRNLKDSELELLTAITIAMDGIAVIVNNENPLSEITADQVRAIFTGEVTSWGDVK